MGGAVSVTNSNSAHRGVEYDENGNVRQCIFCQIGTGEKLPGKEGDSDEMRSLIYEDNLVVAFRSHGIRAVNNFLMIPKIHIANIKELHFRHLSLLKHMRAKAEEQLKKLNNSGSELVGRDSRSFQFSFHVPPHHSIDHLHLHCFQLPFKNYKCKLRYKEGAPHCVSYRKVEQNLTKKLNLPIKGFLEFSPSEEKQMPNAAEDP